MLVEKFNKTEKRIYYYPRLIYEHGQKRLFSLEHSSKKVAKECEATLKKEISEIKMFPERFFKKIFFKDFIPII